jgi:hypothetical protein
MTKQMSALTLTHLAKSLCLLSATLHGSFRLALIGAEKHRASRDAVVVASVDIYWVAGERRLGRRLHCRLVPAVRRLLGPWLFGMVDAAVRAMVVSLSGLINAAESSSVNNRARRACFLLR